MLDLALHATEGPVPLADISKRQCISLSYLEQLFSKLRKQGLVNSARGPGGGYQLSRDANAIHVAAIITAIDEKISVTRCEGRGDCMDGEPCLTHTLWNDLSTQICSFLEGITLGTLVERREVQQVAARLDKKATETAVDLPHIASAR
jgi:Rrf2 family iron-sulfur cluster assembly transcriptional regulator